MTYDFSYQDAYEIKLRCTQRGKNLTLAVFYSCTRLNFLNCSSLRRKLCPSTLHANTKEIASKLNVIGLFRLWLTFFPVHSNLRFLFCTVKGTINWTLAYYTMRIIVRNIEKKKKGQKMLKKLLMLHLTLSVWEPNGLQSTPAHCITWFSPTFQETTKVKFSCIVLSITAVINRKKSNLCLIQEDFDNTHCKRSTCLSYSTLSRHTNNGIKSTQTCILFHMKLCFLRHLWKITQRFVLLVIILWWQIFVTAYINLPRFVLDFSNTNKCELVNTMSFVFHFHSVCV